MNYALLVSDLQGVYHVQHESQAPTVLVKPVFVASAFMRKILRLLARLQRN